MNKHKVIRQDDPGVAGITVVVGAAPADDDPFTLVINLYRWPLHRTIQIWEVQKHYHIQDGTRCEYSPTGHCYYEELKQYRQDSIRSAVDLFGWPAVAIKIIEREALVAISVNFEKEIISALEWLADARVKPEQL